MNDMHPVKFLFFFCVSILATGCLHAQELLLKHYTINDGLPSNEVYQVEEGANGQLLIATDRGVVQYDGYTFQKLQSKYKMGIQPVLGFYKDPAGTIYLYGSKKIFIFKNDSLYPYRYNDKIIPKRYNGELLTNEPAYISSLTTNGDSLWLIFTKPGGMLIMPEGKTQYLQDKGGLVMDLKHNLFYRNKTLLDYYKHWTRIFITWPDGSASVDSIHALNADNMRRIMHTRINGLDILLAKQKLFVYKNGRKVNEYNFSEMPLLIREYKGKLWICFEYGGAKLYDITASELKETGLHILSDFSVSNMFFDFQGGIWFCTLESGLYYVHPNYFRIWHYNDRILSVRKINDNAVVCYKSGIIRIFHNSILQKEISVSVKSDEVFLDAYVTANNNYFIITDLGVYHHRGGKSVFYPIALPVSRLVPSNVHRMLYPMDDNTFFIGAFMGLRNRLVRFTASQGYVDSMKLYRRILSMVKDDNGDYWLGMFDRLCKRSADSLYVISDKSSLFQTRFIDIANLSNKWLAMATLGNGLLLYNYQYNKLIVLNEENGLPSIVFNKMQVVNDTIWLSTNKGMLSVYYNGKFNIRIYDKIYGFPTVDIKDFCIANGWLYFKGDADLYSVRMSHLQERKLLMKPVITAVQLNNKVVNYKTDSVFGYREKDVNIHFKSANFERNDNQLYQYRLSGNGSSKWYITTERQVLFTNLQPGEYTFEVRVVDDYHQYKTESAGYAFTIQPPFWKTIWFYVIVIMVVIVCIVTGLQLRLKAIKRRNALLLSLAEHQQKALVQQMSPHFIYNIVNTAQSAMIHDNKMQAITILARFTRLMRLSLELSREKMVLVSKEIAMLEKYLELETVRFPERFTYNINIGRRLDPNTVYIPSMLMQPFVENAIKHGISHLSGKKGHIEIMLQLQDGVVMFTVDDNGVGRQRSAVINSNRAKYHRSAGIDITVQRLELLHKEKDEEMIYTIQDKYNEDGSSAGTLVTFSIPYQYTQK